jgi:hypothetical protein
MRAVAKLTWKWAWMLALGSAIGACSSCSRGNREDQAFSTTTTTGASLSVSNQEAITVLMEARCTRAAECRTSPPGVTTELQVGIGASHEECLATIGPGLHSRLGRTPCPLGIDGPALERCLQNLKSQACMDPPTSDSFDGFISCRSDALCPHVASNDPMQR